MAMPWRAVVSEDQVRAEMDAVLAAKAFARAPSLSKILRYLCEQELQGKGDLTKEYSIAVEALGRRADFDPQIDSIVRVEVSRLRKRLSDYYESEGSAHAVKIRLQEGSYSPAFVAVEQHADREAAIESAPTVPVPVAPAGPTSLLRPPDGDPARKRHFSGRRYVQMLTTVLVLLAAIVSVFTLRRSTPVRTSAGGQSDPNAGQAAASQPVGPEFRLLVGSKDSRLVDSSNRVWAGDRFFRGGTVVSRPDRHIRGTLDPLLYRVAREGNFRYDIPLKPGNYELHLHFCELLYGEENQVSTGEGSRRFRVSVNGTILLRDFDILSDAGSENTADEKRFTDISPASDGILHLEFVSETGKASLSGIELLPGVPGKQRPIRILAGTSGVRADSLIQWWSGDRYFLGGASFQDGKPVAGAAQAAILRSERYGHFRYAIPVVQGRYTVSLYFADTNSGPRNFGAVDPNGGASSNRLFDVFCNGAALLRSFDILKESGGPDRVLVKTFHGLTPNPQGKLLFSFIPVNNYACVRAIEVIPE